MFEPDTCSALLGLPTCAQWVPDDSAFIKYLTHVIPDAIGAWCLIGIVAASMSTADGAILAIGTVTAHNIARQLEVWWPWIVEGENNLLRVTRLSTVPFTICAAVIAAYYKTDGDGAAGGTGYLLIVAFDLVLATVVVPLFGCFYAKTPRPNAAFLAFVVGATVRITLEFALPKDGWLLLPYDQPEFLDYGEAASPLAPVFVDAPPEEVWNPDDPNQTCDQDRYSDFTGVDSLSAFFASIVVFTSVQYIEHHIGRLFTLPGMEPYEKFLDEGTKEELHGEKLTDETTETVSASRHQNNKKEEGVVEAVPAEEEIEIGGEEIEVGEEEA